MTADEKKRDHFAPNDIVEIRVHGVSNTPPESMLDIPQERLVQVAGDGETLIYRAEPELPREHLVRAYSWGNLTHSANRAAKDLQRALWMIYLPFAFVNVALWTRLRPPESVAGSSHTRGWSAFVIRFFALSLTVTLAAGASGVFLDQVIYQWAPANCEGARRPGITANVGWLSFLREPSLCGTSRGVAIGMAATIAVILVLWFFARKSFQYESESVLVEEARTNDATVGHPMESKWFWRGNHQVRTLSSIHLTWAIGSVVLLTLAPLWGLDKSGWRWTSGVIGAATALLMAIALGLLGVSKAVKERSHEAEGDRRHTWVVGSTLLLAALALAVLAWSPTRLPESAGNDGMRFYDETVIILCAAQVLVLVGLWIWGVWKHRRSGKPTTVGFKGKGPATLCTLGWMVAILYSSVVLFYTADYLNGAGNPVGADNTIQLPLALEVTSAWVIPVLILTAILGYTQYRSIQVPRNAYPSEVFKDYGDPEPSRRRIQRARSVERARRFHSYLEEKAVDRIGTGATWLLVIAGVITVGVAVEQFTPDRFTLTRDHPSGFREGLEAAVFKVGAFSAGTGARVLLLLAIVLAFVAYQIYRGGTARRVLGIVWDVATFWPRACHPWAPPCYAERVVPQLATYIGNRPAEPMPGFILAGHSQGSVVGAATLWQLPVAYRKRCAFLTFGTQLRAFYGRAFPGFFSPEQLGSLAVTLRSNEPGPLEERTRWRSLWRKTDPIGYLVDYDDMNSNVELTCIDHAPLKDPERLGPQDDDYVDAPIRGHSNYWLDPIFDTEAAHLAALMRRKTP